MVRVLAFDQSLNFAYATDRPGGAPPLTSLKRLPFDGENFGRAYSAARQLIKDAIAVHKPDEVWFESPIFVRGDNIVTSAQTMRILLYLAGAIEEVAHDCGVPVFEVNNMTWKKFFVGSGHAKKKDTQDKCEALGWGRLDNNCADAAAIWAYAKACDDEEFSAHITPLFAEAT